MRNYYEILKIDPTVELEEIIRSLELERNIYSQQTNISKQEIAVAIEQLEEIEKILLDPIKRAEYNRKLQKEQRNRKYQEQIAKEQEELQSFVVNDLSKVQPQTAEIPILERDRETEIESGDRSPTTVKEEIPPHSEARREQETIIITEQHQPSDRQTEIEPSDRTQKEEVSSNTKQQQVIKEEQLQQPIALAKQNQIPVTSSPQTRSRYSSTSGLKDWQKSILTGSVIGIFILLGFILIKPKTSSQQSTQTSTEKSSQNQESQSPLASISFPNLLGTWSGSYASSKPNVPASNLYITSQSGDLFEGTLVTRGIKGGTFTLAIEGKIDLETMKVFIKETSILSRPATRESWFLGTNSGTVSPDLQQMAGKGYDVKGNSYSWSFSKN